MVTKTLDDDIKVTKGIADGNPRIAGHRITVQNVVIWHELLGLTHDPTYRPLFLYTFFQ